MSDIETFSLVKERCKFAHLNIRTERHGEEEKPAVDIKMEFTTANNLLSKLHPGLCEAFYKKDDNADLIGDEQFRALRFPLMKNEIAWNLEIPRTLLRLHGDMDGADIVMAGGKTNNFKLAMLEGGSVKWSFRVQYSEPDETAVAALSQVLSQTMHVSLECAEEEQEDLFKQVEQQTQEPPSDARLAAEKLFDAPQAEPDELPATMEAD